MKETFKTIGKESEKIGNTLVTGEGAVVKIREKEPETTLQEKDIQVLWVGMERIRLLAVSKLSHWK